MKKRLRTTFPSLRLHGPDQKGIVAACSNVLDKFGCGIVQSETWTDRFEHLFFHRLLFNHDDDGGYGYGGADDNTCGGRMSNSTSTHGNSDGGNLSTFASASMHQPMKTSCIHSEKMMEIDYEMEKLKDQFGLSSMKIDWRDKPKKVAVFVSKYDHCLVSMIMILKN